MGIFLQSQLTVFKLEFSLQLEHVFVLREEDGPENGVVASRVCMDF